MALDMDAKGAYKEWSEDERKELNFWLLNRYASSVGGSQDAKEWAVIATNEYYNKNWNVLGTRHPQLQWQLLCSTHNSSAAIRKHQWIGFKKKKGNNNAIKLLQKIHPNMKQDEVELLAGLSTKKELKELAKEYDIDIKL